MWKKVKITAPYCICKYFVGLTNSALVHEPKCWGEGGGGLRGLSQWVQLYTRSPNKFWRSNSILNAIGQRRKVHLPSYTNSPHPEGVWHGGYSFFCAFSLVSFTWLTLQNFCFPYCAIPSWLTTYWIISFPFSSYFLSRIMNIFLIHNFSVLLTFWAIDLYQHPGPWLRELNQIWNHFFSAIVDLILCFLLHLFISLLSFFKKSFFPASSLIPFFLSSSFSL